MKGYRYKDKGFSLYYGEPQSSIFVYEDYTSDLMNWVKQNFPDLDQQDREVEYYHILNNVSLTGKSTSADREEPVLNDDERIETLDPAKLDAAFERSYYIMIAYDAIAFVALLFNAVSVNRLVSIFMIVYPLVGIVIIATSKSLIRLSPKQTSPRHSLIIGMAICCAVLCMARLHNIVPVEFNYSTLFIVLIAAGFIITVHLVDKAEKNEPYSARRLWLLAVACLYGYGAVTQLGYILSSF